jgi:hypothetical protein
MSGPTIIDYRALERRRAEAARRRWRALRGRAQALDQRCRDLGHPECAVKVGQLVGSSSEDIERACEQLERAVAGAARELERRQFNDRTKEVVANLHDVLTDLERREQQAAGAATGRQQESAREPVRGVDYTEKVSRLLASLKVSSPDFDRAAQSVLAATDPARARLLYADLDDRIAEANRKAAAIVERRALIEELRAQLDGLVDPDPIDTLLDYAASVVERGDDIETYLQQARTAITDQQDALADASDREFVRQAVADSLSELGYEVADVEVETAGTLVYRQSETHGVRAQIRDGEIDLRTVRLGSAAHPAADRDAEDEFCRRLPGVLAAMSRRGVSAAVKDQELPGLHTPETVRLRPRRDDTRTQQDQQQRPAARRRGAR